MAVVPKRLIVCCDGTWNTADQAKDGHPIPTNVTKLALSIADEDSAGSRQCVYYHSGVGTSRRERLTGGAFGVGLSGIHRPQPRRPDPQQWHLAPGERRPD
jgi:uncharacterized protein (DUF2235 family)